MIFDCGSQSFYKLKCTFFRRTGLYGDKDRGYLNQNGTKRSPLFGFVGGLIALQLWSDLLALAVLSFADNGLYKHLLPTYWGCLLLFLGVEIAYHLVNDSF